VKRQLFWRSPARTPYKRMRQFVKYWLPLLIWLGVIFVGSTNLMSAEHTARYIIPFLLWLKPGMSPHTIWVILISVRKCAHVTEYAVLGLLLWRAFRSVPPLRTRTSASAIAVLVGCALFAASDEFHQTFVKSRTPSVRDVFLDIGGAVLGVLIAASFARRPSKTAGDSTHRQFVDAQL
jgi:VanZ family protein